MATYSIIGSLLGQPSGLVVLVVSVVFSLGVWIVYRSCLDGLSHIPGPLICRLTILWDWYHSCVGDQCTQIDRLHRKYGPVVRIGPRDVVISDGKALAPIYSEKGGFLKSPCYTNFDFEGHATIFSSLDPKHRSVRSKAVMPIFSTASIRERSQSIESCVERFTNALREESANAKQASQKAESRISVDVLNVSRGLALDTVCSYLFGQDYGGLDERSRKLSASGYVDSVVVFGKIFFLPNWLFNPILNWSSWLWPSPDAIEGEKKVAHFTSNLLQQSTKSESTYQDRLLRAGITEHETDVQMKDVIFAGTDSTGTNLGTLIWHLAKYPDIYRKVQDEVNLAEKEDSQYDPQNLDYLQAVLRETLRLSLANPTRFPRQVPPSGWSFTSSTSHIYHLPAGTQVGVSPQTLHFNPEVFPEPAKFAPERWINSPTPEMYRDWIPFNVGARQCIARNLAMMELTLALRALAKSNVLSGARPVKDKIAIIEWFNSRIVGERIEVFWE